MGYTVLFFEFFKTGQGKKKKKTDQMLVIVLVQQ